MCRFLRSGTSGRLGKRGYRSLRACWVKSGLRFVLWRIIHCLWAGFNLNFVQTSELSALNNARSENFNNFLFTLSYSTRTDPTQIVWNYPTRIRLASLPPDTAPLNTANACMAPAWPCIDHTHWEIHRWSTLVLYLTDICKVDHWQIPQCLWHWYEWAYAYDWNKNSIGKILCQFFVLGHACYVTV